jgi:hypothetical protein
VAALSSASCVITPDLSGHSRYGKKRKGAVGKALLQKRTDGK